MMKRIRSEAEISIGNKLKKLSSRRIGNEEMSMIGILDIKHRDIVTNEIVDDFKTTMNIVLPKGRNSMIKAFTTGLEGFTVDTIKIGSDTGTGTILDPQPANINTSEDDQQVVYQVKPEEFFIEYPTANSVRFLAVVNGPVIMAEYPTQPNVIYTSASLYNKDGESISYKRFPARTISPLISLDISWTIILN